MKVMDHGYATVRISSKVRVQFPTFYLRLVVISASRMLSCTVNQPNVLYIIMSHFKHLVNKTLIFRSQNGMDARRDR